MIGWKVVRRAGNGGFLSARTAPSTGWSVSYKAGKRSTGHLGTPMLAFRTRANARYFKSPSDRIFKAKLENPRPITTIASFMYPETFGPFWETGAHGTRCAPQGTLACDAITLLEPA